MYLFHNSFPPYNGFWYPRGLDWTGRRAHRFITCVPPQLCCNGGIMFSPCPSRRLSVSASVPYRRYFFQFARILNFDQLCGKQPLPPTHRLNDVGQIGTMTIESRIRQNILIDVNRCWRDVKQVLTPSEWIHKFSCYGNAGTENI